VGRADLSAEPELIRDLGEVGAEVAGDSTEHMLAQFGRPTWLTIPGEDRSRCRALVTLLHGNEPSGVRALHALLRSGLRPAVDLVCFVGAVTTALGPPPFARRSKSHLRDFNRCFTPPFEGEEGRTAQGLLQRLEAARPEALVDLHNTSGESPPYGVTIVHGPRQEGLAAQFSSHLIVTDYRLGALIEATQNAFPSVVIECGGARDPASDELALRGLRRYASAAALPERAEVSLTLLHHPVRVQLVQGASVAFADGPAPGVDVTLHPEVDRHNFGIVGSDAALGWLGPRGLDVLCARDGSGADRIHDLLADAGGELRLRRPMRPLMVTTDPAIALADCLFYIVDP